MKSDNVDLSEVISKLQRVAGLEIDDAKLLVYFAVSTEGVDKLQNSPILVIHGETGSGKSSLMNALGQLSNGSETVDGRSTYPVMRDRMGRVTTLIIEEGDAADEALISNRYSRETSNIPVNRQSTRAGWVEQEIKIFGATILHKREPFKDPGVHGRSIQIDTVKRSGVYLQPEGAFEEHREEIVRAGSKVDWSRVSAYEGDRVKNTIAPVMVVAESLGDYEFIEHMETRRAQMDAELDAGRSMEPHLMVYSEVLSLSLESGSDRVKVKDVSQRLAEGGLNTNSWQASALATRLGFEVKTVGGTSYIYTGGEVHLREIGRKLEIQDEWLEEERAA